MKLLPATSFFFFVLCLFVLNSCKKDNSFKEKKSKIVLQYENQAYEYSEEKKVDSAILSAQKMLFHAIEEQSDISIRDAYYRFYLVYKGSNNLDSTKYYLDKFYKKSIADQDTLQVAKALYKKGLLYIKIDSLDVAYQNLAASKELYKEINDSLQVATVLVDIASIEKRFASFGASQLSSLEGLKYLENIPNYELKSKHYFNIAVAAKEQGDLVTAEKRIEQALEALKKLDASNSDKRKYEFKYSNSKANILKEQKKYDEAIQIFSALLENESLKLTERQTSRVTGNLAHTLFLRDGFSKKIDSMLHASLQAYQDEKYISGLIAINMKLADLYKERNSAKALSYLDNVIQLAIDSGNDKSYYEGLQVRVQIAHEEEDIVKYIDLENKLERKEEAMQSQLANARFDFDGSEAKRIKAERASLTSQREAAENKVSALILALIFVIFLVLAYLIHQKIQRRHKIEKVKTVHHTEARISSKVHDELANDIHNLMAHLETSEPEKESVLDKLDIIYNNARDISKQNRSVETGEGFADELSNLFHSYQSDAVNVLLKRYDTAMWTHISSHVKVTVYRVLQELLTNMKKHSNAGLVVVTIEKKNRQLFIQYTDNGKGFSEKISKNGLQNAENRIHAIQGTLTFDTELQHGCKFSINVPI